MHKRILIAALLMAALAAGAAHAGIFGRRWSPPPQQQPQSGYRSYSYQPALPAPQVYRYTRSNDPRDWKEAHKGYGVKPRGW